jgi:LAO/AO transport system kinase
LGKISNTQPASFFIKGILRRDIAILSRAITLVESTQEEHRKLAREILEGLVPAAGSSFRLGITGVPGVGKSTFIEQLGKEIVAKGHRLAVLAIDPSSSKSKGSILGDKTRMENLSVSADVFIRPSPSSGNLGGITRDTYETIVLCEAAGFNYTIIETVGVGQSETAVNRIADFFLLLMLAGAGDELQGIKRGIMEMADALVITKADGANIEKAKAARTEFAHAMHLLQPPESGWIPRVMTSSAVENTGISEVYKMLEEFREKMILNGYLEHRRGQQKFEIFKESLDREILNEFYREHKLDQYLELISKKGIQNPFAEIEKILRRKKQL